MPFYGDPYTAVSAISDAGGILLSRSSGVTPAFVQVSASAITATGTTRPYETLEYSWDFGDPGGTESLTNPADGGAAVNPNTSQVGPEAAYVYRSAGTYTITLTIRGDDGDGGYITETVTATFTVTAFAADVEYYFDSVNGNNSWNGQSPTFVSGSIGPKASLAGFDYWPTVSVTTAYHFARGGTYDYDSGHRDGMRVDAYGTGAKPILNLTGSNGIYFNIGSADQHFDDIVWSGVDFRNNGIGRSFFFNVSNGSGTWINHLYIDNCAFSRTSATGLTWIQMAGNMEGFGLWNTSLDGGAEIVSSDYLGSTSALGDAACEWRFMLGVTMINGKGDHTIDTPNRAAGHNIYTGSENHQLYRYSSFGEGAKNRYFCFNGNIDGDTDSRCYYWNLSDCELTGMWGAIDLGNEYNNPSISGSMDAVVIERNWIHAMSNESAEDWTNPGTPPPTTFANNDQWIVYASCGLNYTMRSNTFATDCPRADGNGSGVPLEDDIFALASYGAPRIYDNVVGNVGYNVNPLAYDGGYITGYQFNNYPAGYGLPFYGDPYTAVSAISDAGGIVLSRSSGYLPAFVQVSASAITATGTTRPFETLEYTWDFGDPSGTESLVNPADNGATVNPNTSQVGPEAAYVYRTAGTYTITLTIRGYTGSGYVTETCTATFTASAFPADEDWYFDSVSGNNANNGLTSGTAKENLTGFSFWPTEDAYVHYHFARGGTYTYALGNRGITRFSAYGSGAKPILNFSGTGFLLNVANNDQVFEDVVMSDIHIVTSGVNAMRLGVAGGLTNSGINDIYLDNVKITRNAPAEDHDYACFQLSGSTVGVGYWNVETDTGTNYIGAEYLGGGGSWRFFMGCQFLNGRGYTAGPGRQTGHNIYMGSENHQLVRYCELGTGAGGRYFNINMDSNLAAGVVVQYYNISDCELTGFYSHIDMSNTNNDRSTNAVMDDIVVERCWFHDPETVWGSVASVFSYSSDDSTFRENLFEDVATPTTIFYFPDTAARPRIYDNTMPYDPTLPSGGGGFETNNTADNPATFGGDTSGTCDENADYVTGILSASDAVDGMTTPNFTVSVAALHGEGSINSTTGAWSYTPDADYFGSDVFTVRVTDDLGNHDTQVITITVNEVGGSNPTYYAFSAGGLTYVFQTGGA